MVQSSLAVGGSFHSPPLSFPPGGAERHRRRRGSDKGTDPTREVTEDPEAEPHEIENNWPKDRMFTRVVPRLVGLVHFPRASTFVSSLTILSEPEAFGRSEWSEEGKEMNVTSPLLWSVRMSVGLVNASNLHLTSVAERVAREQNDQRRDRYATPYTLPPAPFLGSLRPFGWRSLPTLAYGGAEPKERR